MLPETESKAWRRASESYLGITTDIEFVRVPFRRVVGFPRASPFLVDLYRKPHLSTPSRLVVVSVS